MSPEQFSYAQNEDTCLTLAAYFGHLAVVRYLVEKANANFNKANKVSPVVKGRLAGVNEGVSRVV